MEAHGILKFYHDNHVLYVESFGPFNMEGIIKGKLEYMDNVERISKDKFCVVEIWDEETLTSPDALHVIQELWKTLESYSCCSLAVVIKTVFQKDIVENMLPKIGRVFNNKEEAITWIQNLQ